MAASALEGLATSPAKSMRWSRSSGEGFDFSLPVALSDGFFDAAETGLDLGAELPKGVFDSLAGFAELGFSGEFLPLGLELLDLLFDAIRASVKVLPELVAFGFDFGGEFGQISH